MNDSDSQTLRAGRKAALWGQVFAVACFLSALVAVILPDRLTSVLLVLSTFLFAVVCSYSKRYMTGDPGQSRFTIWLCLTGTCVFALVLAQNLLLFALAWCGTSLSLHQLLRFYGDRPGALLAARKKFLISRLGDATLLAALILTHAEFSTWDFQKIFVAAAHLRAAGPENLPVSVSWIAGLLVFAALLKSAQFPFHSWLPDTMETPTPVSALMHAGIINAGGILVIRLSPLISLSDAALLILCLTGSFTALFASTVMLTQSSVKRCLAFSTVGQMGFMMLECGLGAFHLALLHLVAHSLYKAHAFLSSGSVVLERPVAEQSSVSPAAVVVGLLSAAGIIAVVAAGFRVSLPDEPVLPGIFSLALAHMLWNFRNTDRGIWQVLSGLALGLGFSGAYFQMGRIAEVTVTPLIHRTSWVGLPILSVFFLVAIAQTQLPRLARTSFGRHLYVHARNGFYVNTLANRITTALWPVQISQENL
jgi:NAD(P)H-quinone oxidoreductase subunit 5